MNFLNEQLLFEVSVSVLIVAVLLYFHLDTFLGKKKKRKKRMPYKIKDPFLNKSELAFFEGIQRFIPATHIMFPQVVISSIVETTSWNKKRFWFHHGKINKKTIDFVIFEKGSLKPVIAIEYDGWTHTWRERKLRDRFVNSVIRYVGMEMIRVKHKKKVNLVKVGEKINRILNEGDK